MNNSSIHDICFDPIELETKLDKDYKRSLAEQCFCKEYIDDPSNTFADGKWDGKLGYEPEAYQWASPLYRRGYLAGIAAKYDEKFSD